MPLMEKMLSSSQIHLSSVAVNISALGWWGQSGTTFDLQSISWHKSEPFLFKNLLLSTIFFPRCLIAKFNSPISSASRSFFGNYFIPKVLMLHTITCWENTWWVFFSKCESFQTETTTIHYYFWFISSL